MKKIFFYTISIFIGVSIPLYFTFVWEPLKSERAISVDLIGVDNNQIFNNEYEENNNGLINNEEINTSGMNSETIKIRNDNVINGLLLELENTKKEELNKIFNKLAIVDIIKINNYFSDIGNESNLKEGVLFIKKRISSDEYEYFKSIIKDYINLEDLEGI